MIDYDNYDDYDDYGFERDDVVKYRKKTESSKSKSTRKSKHKHKYAPCLFRSLYDMWGHSHESISIGSYCTICGKAGGNIDKEKYPSAERLEDGNWRMFDAERLKSEYSELPIFTIEDYFQSYVPLTKEN